MCEAKPGPRCASDTCENAQAAQYAYGERHPSGPNVDALANAETAFDDFTPKTYGGGNIPPALIEQYARAWGGEHAIWREAEVTKGPFSDGGGYTLTGVKIIDPETGESTMLYANDRGGWSTESYDGSASSITANPDGTFTRHDPYSNTSSVLGAEPAPPEPDLSVGQWPRSPFDPDHTVFTNGTGKLARVTYNDGHSNFAWSVESESGHELSRGLADNEVAAQIAAKKQLDEFTPQPQVFGPERPQAAHRAITRYESLLARYEQEETGFSDYSASPALKAALAAAKADRENYSEFGSAAAAADRM